LAESKARGSCLDKQLRLGRGSLWGGLCRVSAWGRLRMGAWVAAVQLLHISACASAVQLLRMHLLACIEPLGPGLRLWLQRVTCLRRLTMQPFLHTNSAAVAALPVRPALLYARLTLAVA